MKVIVAKRKPKTLPWGVEIELLDGRAIYIAARNVTTYSDRVDVIVNSNSPPISIPKASIRRILIMGSDVEEETD